MKGASDDGHLKVSTDWLNDFVLVEFSLWPLYFSATEIGGMGPRKCEES